MMACVKLLKMKCIKRINWQMFCFPDHQSFFVLMSSHFETLGLSSAAGYVSFFSFNCFGVDSHELFSMKWDLRSEHTWKHSRLNWSSFELTTCKILSVNATKLREYFRSFGSRINTFSYQNSGFHLHEAADSQSVSQLVSQSVMSRQTAEKKPWSAFTLHSHS